MLILCLKVFFVRILDVSLGTVRTILLVKGKKMVASVVGFIEISIWFAVVKEALTTTESNIWIIIAYAGGFSVGTLVGSYISEKFIKGNINLQIITEKSKKLISVLREHGYAVSVIDIKGKDEETARNMLFMDIDKKDFNHVKNLIRSVDSKAFVVGNETKLVENGYFKK